MEMTCESLEALLPEMMDGQLGSEAEAGAATHLATCESCRVVVDGINRVRTVAREHAKLTMPEDARERILSVLESEEADG